MNATIRFHLFASDRHGEVAGATSALEQASIEFKQVDALGSVPLDDILITGASTLSALVLALGSLRKMFRRGVVVDAFNRKQLSIKADGSVPRGVIVIRNADGQVEVRDAEGISHALLSVIVQRPSKETGSLNQPPSGAEHV